MDRRIKIKTNDTKVLGGRSPSKKSCKPKTVVLCATLVITNVLVGIQHYYQQPIKNKSVELGALESAHCEKITYSKDELKTIFNEIVEKEVKHNNWDMGCNDLQFLAPYFRSILYRRGWSEGRRRKVIIDVGANAGDDTISIMKSFYPILQMCKGYSIPIQLISVEPSPKVFCEMNDVVSTKLTDEDHRDNVLLNVALSDKTGHLIFADPGNEGGKLIGSNYTKLSKITPGELKSFSRCKYEQGEFKSMDVDQSRQSTVPTYTLDLLVSSLEESNLDKIHLGEEIYVVKIDTEGHDYSVLLGAKDLLQNKRITFVVFEAWDNRYVKLIAQHMAKFDYHCFLLTQDTLVPVHSADWWYPHMDEFKTVWWGNGLCGVKHSKDMQMLWRMYHSDNLKLLTSYNLL